MIAGKFTAALVTLQMIGAVVAFAAGADGLAVFLATLSLAVVVVNVAGRYVERHGQATVRVLVWVCGAAACFAIAILMLAGVVDGTAVEAVLFCVAGGGASLAAYGVIRARRSASRLAR